MNASSELSTNKILGWIVLIFFGVLIMAAAVAIYLFNR
jgi:hypothetical protein